MCFLKTLKPLDQICFEKEGSTDDSSFEQSPKDQQTSFLNKLLDSQTPPLLTRQDQLLHTLMTFLQSNNLLLRNIQQKLTQNEQQLNHSHQTLEEMSQALPPHVPHGHPSDLDSETDGTKHQLGEDHTLLTQMFGARKYQYRLQLQQELPTTIFKERNINISLTLIDQNTSQKVLNSNIIHLCLGVCDQNGQWITENKVGETFMKGKTQVEMYHGEGAFLKVYPRDVSRHYPSGKVHFVVYPKPSILKFSSNSNSVERIVDCEEIQPLFISDLTIKAKKG